MRLRVFHALSFFRDAAHPTCTKNSFPNSVRNPASSQEKLAPALECLGERLRATAHVRKAVVAVRCGERDLAQLGGVNGRLGERPERGRHGACPFQPSFPQTSLGVFRKPPEVEEWHINPARTLESEPSMMGSPWPFGLGDRLDAWAAEEVHRAAWSIVALMSTPHWNQLEPCPITVNGKSPVCQDRQQRRSLMGKRRVNFGQRRSPTLPLWFNQWCCLWLVPIFRNISNAMGVCSGSRGESRITCHRPPGPMRVCMGGAWRPC